MNSPRMATAGFAWATARSGFISAKPKADDPPLIKPTVQMPGRLLWARRDRPVLPRRSPPQQVAFKDGYHTPDFLGGLSQGGSPCRRG